MKSHWGILSGKLCIALAKEGHSVAQSLIKPCGVDIAEWQLNELSAKKITALPLSNNTVTWQVKDVAANMKTELISQLQNWTQAIFHHCTLKKETF